MSLFDNGVTEKSTVYFIHKSTERLLSEADSPVLDYSLNSTMCSITPDILADLPGKVRFINYNANTVSVPFRCLILIDTC